MSLHALKRMRLYSPTLKPTGFGNFVVIRSSNHLVQNALVVRPKRGSIPATHRTGALYHPDICLRKDFSSCVARSYRQFTSSSSAVSTPIPENVSGHRDDIDKHSSAANGPTIAQELASGIYNVLGLGSMPAEAAEAALRSSGFHPDVIRR
jgi:hypothetical protein